MRKSLSKALFIAFVLVPLHFSLRAGTIQDAGVERFAVRQHARLEPILAEVPLTDTRAPLNFLPESDAIGNLVALESIRGLLRPERGTDAAWTRAAEYRPWPSLLLVGVALGTMGFAWRGRGAGVVAPRGAMRYVIRN